MASLRILAAVMAGLGTGGVFAQPYPAKAVRVIVPTPAGGNPDFVMRPIAQKLGESFKQPFLIDNRPGAAGTIGVELAARAAPDGHTLLLGAIGHVATTSALYAKLPFDATRDLAPTSCLVDAPFALFLHPSVPARSVKELVALAKARPGQINYASFGVGSFTHFVTEAFNKAAGVKIVHVPYKGSAPAALALLGGEVEAGFDALQSTLPHLKSGRLRGLAIGAAKRLPVAPELPTFGEAGFPRFVASAWFGLFAPVNTPQDIVARLHAEVVKTLATAELRSHFERAGMQIVASTPDFLGTLLREDIARFSQVAREAGIRPE